MSENLPEVMKDVSQIQKTKQVNEYKVHTYTRRGELQNTKNAEKNQKSSQTRGSAPAGTASRPTAGDAGQRKGLGWERRANTTIFRNEGWKETAEERDNLYSHTFPEETLKDHRL